MKWRANYAKHLGDFKLCLSIDKI
ncbi:hypothetical protein Avbf_17840, partial [Armadillidium vulgare]